MNYRLTSRANKHDDYSRRRRYPRVLCEGHVVVQPRYRDSYDGILQDISAGGAFLLSTERLNAGTKVVMYIRLEVASKKQLCIVSGAIIRQQKVERAGVHGIHGLGVKFDADLAKSARLMIDDYVTGKIGVAHTSRRVEISGERSVPERSLDRVSSIVGEEVSKSQRPITNPEQKIARMKIKEKGQEKSVEKSKPKVVKVRLGVGCGRKQKPYGAYIMGVCLLLVFGVGFFVYKTISRTVWVSKLNDSVPMIQMDIDGTTLRAQPTKNWIQETRKGMKERNLHELAGKLRAKGIHGAILVDEEGKMVAQILKNGSNLNRPRVRVIQ